MAEDVRALAAEVLRLGTAPPATMFEWSPGADFEGAARRLARAVLASPAVESAPAAPAPDAGIVARVEGEVFGVYHDPNRVAIGIRGGAVFGVPAWSGAEQFQRVSVEVRVLPGGGR